MKNIPSTDDLMADEALRRVAENARMGVREVVAIVLRALDRDDGAQIGSAARLRRSAWQSRRRAVVDDDQHYRCGGPCESAEPTPPAEDREALVRRMQDEVEYRVRTAGALAKGGHSVQPEVDAGRARIAALAARQPAPVDAETLAERAHAEATRLLAQASPMQSVPWVARLVRDVVDATLAARLPAVQTVSAEQAWDEGFTRGFYAAQSLPSDADASESTVQNPYEVTPWREVPRG